MRRNIVLQKLIAIAAVAACGTVFADPSQGKSEGSGTAMSTDSQQSLTTGNQNESEIFSKLDTNKDGVISPKEAAAMKELALEFNAIDIKKDGKLDQAEFARFEASRPQPSSTPAPSSNYPTQP